jgi:hypothetical protein
VSDQSVCERGLSRRRRSHGDGENLSVVPASASRPARSKTLATRGSRLSIPPNITQHRQLGRSCSDGVAPELAAHVAARPRARQRRARGPPAGERDLRVARKLPAVQLAVVTAPISAVAGSPRARRRGARRLEPALTPPPPARRPPPAAPHAPPAAPRPPPPSPRPPPPRRRPPRRPPSPPTSRRSSATRRSSTSTASARPAARASPPSSSRSSRAPRSRTGSGAR